MRKSEFPAIIKDLEDRVGKKVDNDLIRFKLESGLPGDVEEIGRHFAASNIGFTSAEQLDGISQEEYDLVQSEIDAWTRVMKKAAKLCDRMKLDPTNRNLILLSHHKEADKQYSAKG